MSSFVRVKKRLVTTPTVRSDRASPPAPPLKAGEPADAPARPDRPVVRGLRATGTGGLAAGAGDRGRRVARAARERAPRPGGPLRHAGRAPGDLGLRRARRGPARARRAGRTPGARDGRAGSRDAAVPARARRPAWGQAQRGAHAGGDVGGAGRPAPASRFSSGRAAGATLRARRILERATPANPSRQRGTYRSSQRADCEARSDVACWPITGARRCAPDHGTRRVTLLP